MTIITPEALEGLAGDEISHGGAVPVGIIGQSNKRMADRQKEIDISLVHQIRYISNTINRLMNHMCSESV